MPLPRGAALVMLTLVFIIIMKMLYAIFDVLPGGAAIFDVLPGITCWWGLVKTPVKAIKVEDVESRLSAGALGNAMLKHTGDINMTPAAKYVPPL